MGGEMGGETGSDWLTPLNLPDDHPDANWAGPVTEPAQPEQPEFSLEELEGELARAVEGLRRVEEDLGTSPHVVINAPSEMTRLDVVHAREVIEGVAEQLGEHRRLCAKPWEAPWHQVAEEVERDGPY